MPIQVVYNLFYNATSIMRWVAQIFLSKFGN